MRACSRRVWLLCALPFLCGAFVPQCHAPGSLTADNFKMVSLNGFDPDDNRADRNHYAWAMKYFKGDEANEGYVYVGTGNNVANLILYYFETLISGGDIEDAPVRPPEIRRYRPSLGPQEWERVLDYREIEPEGEWATTGFRFMATYSAADPEKAAGERSNYIYAATQGLESVLWRSKTGDPGDWEAVFTTGVNGASIRWICEHDGSMYLAFAYDTYEAEPPPGEIWVSDDGLNFAPIMQDGFGNPLNRGVQFLVSYNGWLYAGTKNDVEGYEVWKLEGPAKDGTQIRVVDRGGPDTRNEIAGTPVVFNGHLYIGSIIFFGFNPAQLSGFKGCDIIRIDESDNWETVVGPGGLSGYDSGFNHFTNAYLWWMEEHDGWLYAGTWDQATLLALLLQNIDQVMEFFGQAGGKQDFREALEDVLEDVLYEQAHAGADIFKTQDGVHWYPVTIDGFGDPDNYGWRTMESAPDGYLYVGAANPFSGLEVWRATAMK